MDRSGFNDRRSYLPGFFAQDMMRATGYRYAGINSLSKEPRKLSFLLVDRRKKRYFSIHSKWINILSARFTVHVSNIFILEFILQIFYIGVLDFQGASLVILQCRYCNVSSRHWSDQYNVFYSAFDVN